MSAGVNVRWNGHFEMDVLISDGTAAESFDALVSQHASISWLSSWRHRNLSFAGESGNGHGCSKNRLTDGDWHVHVNIRTFSPENRTRFHLQCTQLTTFGPQKKERKRTYIDSNVQVSRLSSGFTDITLSRQSEILAAVDACWNLHCERSRLLLRSNS